MVGPLIADTGGLLRAITKRPDRRPMWPPFARTLATASRVVVPGPVLTEVDYFLRDNRPAMRQLVAELFDPGTTLEYHHATQRTSCGPFNSTRSSTGLRSVSLTAWSLRSPAQRSFPPGWDEQRVEKVLAHYETQAEDEALAEDEAAFGMPGQTVMEVPSDLVPAVRELIAKHNK